MRKLLTTTLLGALVGTLGLAAPALAQDTLTGFTGTVGIQGAVTGVNEAEVRIYVSGLMVASGSLDAAGRYDVSTELSGERDETVVVWFLPDDAKLVPELLILKESSEARRNAIWSPCVPRMKPQNVLLYDVTFRTNKGVLKGLEDSDCFERG